MNQMYSKIPDEPLDSSMVVQTRQFKELVPPEKLAELSRRSDWEAWKQTVPFFGAIGLCGWALHEMWGTYWAIPLFIVQGTLLSYGYAAQHELSHMTAFRTRFLNIFWGHVIGFLKFFPFWSDRSNHMLHHRFTGVRRQDFELEKFRAEDKPFTVAALLRWLFAYDYVFRLCKATFDHMLGRLTRLEREFMTLEEQVRIIVEAWCYGVGYALILAASIYYQSPLALQVWIFPLMAMKWLHQMHNLTEHYGLAKVEDILSNTRTIYTTPINRFLVWNMCYHTAHHRFANVPFYHLKELDRIIRKDVKHSMMGYLPFHREVFAAAISGRRFGYEGLM